MGANFAQQIEKEYPMLNDPWLDNYVATLGRKIISQGVPDPKFEYKFRVVNSPEVNAFAVPGGYLYVNVGLLKEAETEAELVGVWGHEIGHVIHRHGTKQATDSVIVQGAVVAGTELSKGKLGDNAQYVGMGALLFGKAGLLKYGRNAELESDVTGVDILYRTNYDAYAMPNFFRKLLALEKQRGAGGNSGLGQLFSTHPPTNDRIERCEKMIQERGPQTNPIKVTDAFLEMKKRVATMDPPKAQQRK